MTNTLNVDLVATDTCYNPLYERYNYSFSTFMSLNRFTESSGTYKYFPKDHRVKIIQLYDRVVRYTVEKL